MSKFNKEFEYKGYKFNTSVELNTKVEKRINGKKWHTIITNCLGANNFYTRDEIETFQIEEYVKLHYEMVTTYVDRLTYKPNSFEEQLLTSLGFSK